MITLCQQWTFFPPEASGVFQDDNAKVHRANIVKSWFSEHDTSFQHLIWPPQSPDLNPIENLWDVLERDLRAHTPLPTSIKDVGDLLMKLWPKIKIDTLKKLVASMPRRMKAVITAKGSPKKY